MACAAVTEAYKGNTMLRHSTVRAARSLPFPGAPASLLLHTSSSSSSRASLALRRHASVQVRAAASSFTETSSSPSAAPPAATPAPPESATPGVSPSERVKVAELDVRRGFREHWSVDFWQRFNLDDFMGSPDESVSSSAPKVMSSLQNAISSSGMLSSTLAAQYWAYHLARMGFFVTQGLSGLLATELASRPNNAPPDATQGNRLTRLFTRGAAGPVSEALGMFYQDLQHIEQGKYNLPWDMVTSGHRQFNPLFVLNKASRFMREAVGTLARRDSGAPTNVWFKSSLYPDYYLNTFHYQTDGWMSDWSARVYETSTETLFLGRQDAMQRQTLVPLSDFMKGRDAAATRVLEVACGTGRFATFLKDNYPALQYTALDLSPYYLEEARSNMRYWKRMRAPELQAGGWEGTGAKFIQAPGENIPEPDESYDVVYSIYMFHELPADVRRQVASEMARCCKPGGMVILTDSSQTGDRPVFDKTLGQFGDFNEPYYRNYIETDIGELFCAAGMVPDTKVLASSTKVLSFRKPLNAAAMAAAAAGAAAEAPTSMDSQLSAKADLMAAAAAEQEQGSAPSSDVLKAETLLMADAIKQEEEKNSKA